MMTSDAARQSVRGERGFSLIEVLVSMAITVTIVGAALSVLADASRATDVATLATGLNGGLRTAMDLIVRDLMQVGQGLPAGRVVFIPSGVNAQPIRMPGPPGTAFTISGATELSAITAWPALGPAVDGRPTDVITMLAVDSAFDSVNLRAFPPTGGNITVAMPATNVPNGADIHDGGPDDLAPGDLLMLTKNSASTLVQVTRVAGQAVFFDSGDSLNLNQGANVDGTAWALRNGSPETPVDGLVPTRASRVRMITYYVDTATDPAHPRLVRRMNAGDPVTFDNALGTAVAFDVDGLQFTYDLVDGVSNPVNVRFADDDLDGTGACSPDPCSPNQMRKVNVMLAMRSRAAMRGTQRFFRNTLVSQVSLRSLALVDRYR